MKTSAVVFPEADKYKVAELTLDAPGADDFVVKTLVTAISPGTERWILRGKHAGTEFPCVPGYHRIGIVESCGADVTGFKPGNIVYGSGNRWKETDIISMWGAHVGYSVSTPEGYTLISSESPDIPMLSKCAFIIVVGVANRGVNALQPQKNEQITIIGGGIIGICAAQLSALRGAIPTIIELDPERIALIEKMGINVVNGADPDVLDKLKEFAPDGIDIIYDSVGHAPTTDKLITEIKSGGRLLLQAQYFDKERCALDLDAIKIKEVTIKTTIGIDDNDFQQTLDNIRSGRLDMDAIITHRFKAPDDMLKGYELLDNGKPFNLGIVFEW